MEDILSLAVAQETLIALQSAFCQSFWVVFMRTFWMVLATVGLGMGTMFFGSAGNSTEGYVIVLLGAPGSGKGTQAVDLSQDLNIPHISLGDLLRDHKKRDTDLGKEAGSYMNQGLLVPDSLVIRVLADRVTHPDSSKGYILDGFPRTLEQAKELEKNILGSRRLVVVNLDVSDQILVKRLGGRGREDDTPDVVQQRLKVYHDQTSPLINFYKKKGVLVNIEGDQPIDRVFADILDALNEHGVSSAI